MAVISAGLELHSITRKRLEREIAALVDARVKVPVAEFEQVLTALDELSAGLHRVILSSIEAH